MKAHMTQWSKIGDMRDQGPWCFCGHFFPVWAYGETLTTGCLSDIKRLKSAERTLCLLFLVLHSVFVFLCCSLPSLIPFFLSVIAAFKGLLWAPGAWDHCAFHNKDKTSHVCKMGSSQLDRFFKQAFQQGKGSPLLWISEASSTGWGRNWIIQSDLIRVSQCFILVTLS